MSNSNPETYTKHETGTDTQADIDLNGNTGRRRFIGYLIAAPTLAAAAHLGGSAVGTSAANAKIPSPPNPSELLDLSDLLVTAAKPTSNLIAIKINEDGTASFALPRNEMGQGVTTAAAILIAEELDLPLEKVKVTLADARPELVMNQFTGGSATVQAQFTPIRVAAALARHRLLEAASTLLGGTISELTSKAGSIIAQTGESIGYGDLASRASVNETTKASVDLKPKSEFAMIGKPHNRIDAHDAVTGRKQFAMDLDISDAQPTMICRPPTINGTAKKVKNGSAVLDMPGVTDIATIDTGVAVRAKTFGQCIDAIRELDVEWSAGSADNLSDDVVVEKCKKAELPMVAPPVPLLGESIESEFTFAWRSNSALEPQCAVADVRKDRAEIWASIQSPIYAQETIAADVGLPLNKVTVHVVQGGGGFGRMMFIDAPLEAAQISKKMGKPIKLMWHRTDDFRVGRVFPMATTKLRANLSLKSVVSMEQRYTGAAADYTHGFGEILTSTVGKLPAAGNLGLAQTIFETTQRVPYNFGVATQLLNEIFTYNTLHTGAVRHVYSPNVITALELFVDQIAERLQKDPYEFRREYVKDKRLRKVLDLVTEKGDWGRKMPKGTAQGLALCGEYNSAAAMLVEIDTRDKTVNRPIREGVTGPRVMKVIAAVDVGLPVNPRGVEAQIQGGIMDGIGQALTESMHLKDGNYHEGSWDDYHYMRQWNTPREIDVTVLEANSDTPGGAGELSVGPSKAATATAYARAIGKVPKKFPINHDDELTFEPLPREPAIPQSPTSGLKYTF